ncbi:zinc ribbon domain-containing protein [Anaerosporobacter sp.]
MSLIKCPECGIDNVSSTAKSCPHCGFGIKNFFDESQEIVDAH